MLVVHLSHTGDIKYPEKSTVNSQLFWGCSATASGALGERWFNVNIASETSVFSMTC